MKNQPNIALAQMNVVPGRPDLNAQYMIVEIEKASKQGVDIIVFPEMAVPGYFIGDLYEDEAFVRDCIVWNQKIADATSGKNIVAVFGSIGIDTRNVGHDGRLRKFNAGFVAQNGVLLKNKGTRLNFTIKSLLPNYRFFRDSQHFVSIPDLVIGTGRKLESFYEPFGVKVQGDIFKLGVMLCEDMWSDDYSFDPGVYLAKAGSELLVNMSCSPWTWQKNAKRHRVAKSLAEKTGLPMVYVNNVGIQNTGKNILVFDGGSTVYDQYGKIRHQVTPFSSEVSLVGILPTEYILEESNDTAELFDAVVAGTRGFFGTLPPHLRKVVVGVSGGIDSAAALALFVHVLGKENVIAVNLPFDGYTSDTTQDLAKQLAQNLGVEYRVVPIKSAVDALSNSVKTEKDGDTYRSTQARMRMMVLADIAQEEGAIFSCNTNKVEATFGYGTLNGDLRGSFAPWLDLVKGEVYQLSNYMNQEVFRRGVIPQGSIDIAPMDELSIGTPGDPFDYGNGVVNGYHDEMVRAFVEFRKNPEWFLEHYKVGTLEQALKLEQGKLQKLFKNSQEFIEDLERCWRLFHQGYFKRIQAVPFPVVSKRAYGSDYQEAFLGGVYYTGRYQKLKEDLLGAPSHK